MLRNVNWLGEKPLRDIAISGLSLYVRMRSSQKLRPALLKSEQNGTVRVELHDGEEGIATGQACVFYADDGAEARVLGGGWIDKTIKANAAETHVARTMAELGR
jgi:tRNA-uridine 2-sulfurtransferase